MELKKLKVDSIIESKNQLREGWDEEEMKALVANIAEKGISVPVKVRPTEDPAYYELVYGHRRLEAATRAGLETVPALVQDMTDEAAFVESVIENVLREDMTPIEEARALQRMRDKYSWTITEMADRGLGSRTWIYQRLNLLQEEPDIQDKVVSTTAGVVPKGKLTEKHIRHTRTGMGKESNPKDRAKILNKAAMESLTGDETEEVAESYAAAFDEEERAAILQTPYHDPAYQQRVKAKASLERKKKRERPEVSDRIVAEYIGAMNVYRSKLVEATAALRQGRFSPEARERVRRWHDDVTEKIMMFDQISEEQDG